MLIIIIEGETPSAFSYCVLLFLHPHIPPLVAAHRITTKATDWSFFQLYKAD